MDSIEWFQGVIAYLLAVIIYEFGDGNNPAIISIPVLLTLYFLPVYLVIRPIFDYYRCDSV